MCSSHPEGRKRIPKKKPRPPAVRATRKRKALPHAPFLALGAAVAFLCLMPWTPHAVGTGLDPSWRWLLHDAWQRDLVFGRDIIFTFGPFGFLFTETYHPATYGLMLAIFAPLVLILTWALWRILITAAASPAVTALGMVLFILSICLWDVSQTLPFHLCFVLWALYWLPGAELCERRPGKRAEGNGGIRPGLDAALLHSLAGALALASLVKFTSLTMAAGPLLSIAAYEIWKKRRIPWVIITAGGSGLLLWLLAGQPLGALVPYLRNSIEIASGFNQAMALEGPSSEVAAYLAAAALLLFLSTPAQWKRRRWAAVLPAGALALMLFSLFKVAFVRHDAHALTPAPALLPWGILLLLALWNVPPVRLHRPAAAICLSAALVYSHMVVANYLQTPLHLRFAGTTAAIAAKLAAVDRLLRGEGPGARHNLALKEIRESENVPPLKGSTDVYPSELTLVAGNGLEYSPRPVIQSYSAYTPALSRMNADHLAGPKAPENILFAVGSIDARYPSLEDSLSWPELFTRYGLTGATERHLVLRKRPIPGKYSLEPLEQRELRLGEWSRLREFPRDTLVWARLRFRPTWRGRIGAMLYKPPTIVIAAKIEGEVAVYRILPELAGAGFLFSPLVKSNKDFGELLFSAEIDAPRLPRVESILICGNKGEDISSFYQSTIEAQWFSLVLR